MDKKFANKVVADTLGASFKKDSFIYFVKNLLNKIEETPFVYRGNLIPDAYDKYINTLERIGKYTDGENNIDILIVNLKKETSIERARTMQRNFIAWYLNGSRGGEMKDAALVAFVAPNQEDWRFSLVKMDYKFEEKKDGRKKVKEVFTPARRWSFLVGENENSHTAQSRLSSIVCDDEHNPTLKELEDAFNIEKVTKEFFEKYRELFLRVQESLDETVKKDQSIGQDFEVKGIDVVDFGKKLLGQIVFLYFLQKKGWFGVERDADWGTGPKNFLRELFNSKHSNYKNFFNDILEPLFYEALAREREDNFYSRFDCKIPFLNGGLFDPINNYDWVHTDILLPNDLFSNSYKTKEGDEGNGILDIFDRYNFTVKEDEPLEKEVAVDPEMLGKVFENLLEVKDRKSKGTYYTPREIVHYMCEQSVLNYLLAELSGTVAREDIEKLIKHGELVIENESRIEETGKETKTYKYKLPESIRKNAKLIDEKLADIKVCDPAVGSGAFPVGMMTEIVNTRAVLSAYIKDGDRTIYDFKRHCIQSSLYGVDIDLGAVEIAKLRLWLSLVVDEDDIKAIKPLPNLDYKIMQGNSLLEEFEGVKLFDEKLLGAPVINAEIFESNNQRISKLQTELMSHYIKNPAWLKNKELDRPQEVRNLEAQLHELLKNKKMIKETGYEQKDLFASVAESSQIKDELEKLHKRFFEETNKNKKDELKERIERLDWELIEITLKEQKKKSALKKLEEFKQSNTKPFFLWRLNFADVFEKGGFDVVIANPPYGANIDKDVPLYQKIYNEVIRNYADIYKIFFYLGLKILKPSGIETFITPNTYLAQPRYKDLRKYLLRFNLKEIMNLGEEVFEGVVVPTCITFIEKTSTSPFYLFVDVSVNGKYAGSLSGSNILRVKTEQVNQSSDFSLLQVISLKEDEVVLDRVLDVRDAGIQYHRSGIGLKNKGGGDLYDRLFSSDRNRFPKSHPVWYGKKIGKYYICENTDEYFNLEYKSVLKKDESVSFSMEAFQKKEKILWRQTAPYIIATLDDKGVWFRNTIQCGWLKNEFEGKIDLRFILAVLNSDYVKYLYQKIVNESSNRAFPQVKISHIKKLPIKIISLKEQKPFIKLVDKILDTVKNKDYFADSEMRAKVKEYEAEIDKMVCKLYGLTPEEIKVIENNRS